MEQEAVKEVEVSEKDMRPKLSEEAQKALDVAKEKGLRPSYIIIANQEYIYRGINRKEWREIVSKRNNAIMAAEEDQVKIADIQEDEVELIAGLCLVYPEYDINTIGAGTVQHLADLVLFEAGFGGPDIQAVKL